MYKTTVSKTVDWGSHGQWVIPWNTGNKNEPTDAPSLLSKESCPFFGTGGNLAESSGRKPWVEETGKRQSKRQRRPELARQRTREEKEAAWVVIRALRLHLWEEATEGCGKNHLEELEGTVNGTDTGSGSFEKHILIHGPLGEDSQGSGFKSRK